MKRVGEIETGVFFFISAAALFVREQTDTAVLGEKLEGSGNSVCESAEQALT